MYRASLPSLLLAATFALAFTSIVSDGGTRILFEKENRGVVDRPAFLDRLISSVNTRDVELIAPVDWRSRDLGEIQDIIPKGICDSVDALDTHQLEELSRYLLNNLVADRYWVCMALAEEIGCQQSNACGDARVVPVAVGFEMLDGLSPVPVNPPCAHIVRAPVLVDDNEPVNAAQDWYRRLMVWRATCQRDGKDVEYHYNHHDGWMEL